jgi:O-succinylbenzoic acid--CoA ligase
MIRNSNPTTTTAATTRPGAASATAACSGALPAIALGARAWSAAELDAQAAALVAMLAAAGVGRGEVLLRAADDPIELLLLKQALLRCDAALLPYPSELSAPDIDALAAAVGAEWHWALGQARATGRRRPASGAARWPAPALLVRTSGSGGAPKVVMLTAAQLSASALRASAALDLRRGDEWLCCLPLHHVGGLAIGWRCALAGATMRLVGLAEGPAGEPCAQAQARCETRRPSLGASASGAASAAFDTASVAATLRAYPVTHLSLVPAMLARLLEVLPTPPASLRVLLLGGQALQPALARRALAGGWPLYVSYGMSETGSMIAVGRWGDDDAPGVRVGPALADVSLDCAGADAPPRALRLRGPMLMAGYATPTRAPGIGLDADGALVTADLARCDADGVLRVFGRADDLVVIGGEQVSPLALELRLAAAPGVREVVVVALPHPSWGATLAACWRGPATAAELAAWCRAALPSRQRPRLFRQVEALPLLASGKPDRRALVAMLQATPDACTAAGTASGDASRGSSAHPLD